MKLKKYGIDKIVYENPNKVYRCRVADTGARSASYKIYTDGEISSMIDLSDDSFNNDKVYWVEETVNGATFTVVYKNRKEPNHRECSRILYSLKKVKDLKRLLNKFVYEVDEREKEEIYSFSKRNGTWNVFLDNRCLCGFLVKDFPSVKNAKKHFKKMYQSQIDFKSKYVKLKIVK